MASAEFTPQHPPIRPKFNLGGQVSRYSSNPQILTSSNSDVNEDGDNQIQAMSASNKNRSLNPELLMREFTQDETGRIDSFGVTDSPSACFQSQFAREVVQNTRKSGSILDLPSQESTLTTSNSLSSNSHQHRSARRNGSYLTNSNPKYRSQFAAKHHQVSKKKFVKSYRHKLNLKSPAKKLD